MKESSVVVTKGNVNIVLNSTNYKSSKGRYSKIVHYPKTVKDNNMNVFDYIRDLNTAELWLLTEAIKTANYKTNIANIVPEARTEKNHVVNGYKKLYEDGYICRVKRGYYMINPNTVDLSAAYRLDALILWNRYCHPNAVIEVYDGDSYEVINMDITEFMNSISLERIRKISDTELTVALNKLHELNWLDSNGQLTKACLNRPQVSKVIDEAKQRGLI